MYSTGIKVSILCEKYSFQVLLHWKQRKTYESLLTNERFSFIFIKKRFLGIMSNFVIEFQDKSKISKKLAIVILVRVL